VACSLLEASGSGKTTILDAITFALYGGLAGDEAARTGCARMFAAPDAEPSVSLEFSVRGVRPPADPGARARRPNGAGRLTTEAAMCTCSAMRVADGSALSANKAEAGEMITELMGLNRGPVHPGDAVAAGAVRRVPAGRDDERRVLLSASCSAPSCMTPSG